MPRPKSGQRRWAILFAFSFLSIFGFKAWAPNPFQGGPDGEAADLLKKSESTADNPDNTSAMPALPHPMWPDRHSPFIHYPQPDTFQVKGKKYQARYAVDEWLNGRISSYLSRYRPEYAVVLVADLETGNILGVGERSNSEVSSIPRMTFGGNFPAASLAKILTSVAAIETHGKNIDDSIVQVGPYHTLYHRQVNIVENPRLPRITLEEAFAKSVNPAFAILGQRVGPEALRKYGEKFGFNRPLSQSLAIPSRLEVPDTGFHLSEISCGYTKSTTISPLHALQIARGAGFDGIMKPCVFSHETHEVATGFHPEVRFEGEMSAFISPENLGKLQQLMESTVRHGTARKGFRSVFKEREHAKLSMGGKTGSLNGDDPKGRYDWFIGYGKFKDTPSKGIAVAVMFVHSEYKAMRSSQMAALLIRDWAKAQEKNSPAEAATIPLEPIPPLEPDHSDDPAPPESVNSSEVGEI